MSRACQGADDPHLDAHGRLMGWFLRLLGSIPLPFAHSPGAEAQGEVLVLMLWLSPWIAAAMGDRHLQVRPSAAA